MGAVFTGLDSAEPAALDCPEARRIARNRQCQAPCMGGEMQAGERAALRDGWLMCLRTVDLAAGGIA